MYKVLFIALLMGANTFQGQTQVTQDTLYYSKTFDDPQFTMVAGGLSYDLSLNDYNFTLLGLGLDAIFMHPKFAVNLYSRYHLGERIVHAGSGTPLIESIYEPEHSMDFTVNGTYFFKTVTVNEENAIRLKHSGNTDYYSFIDSKTDNRYGAELAINSGFTYYSFGDESYFALDPNGNPGDLKLVTENRGFASYFSQQTLRFGLSRTKVNSFGAKFSNYGKKSLQEFSRIYLHGIFGMNQQVDDVLLSDESEFSDEFIRYDISTNMTYAKFGIAVGYENYILKLDKNFGVGYKIELGLNPGPTVSKYHNAYLNIKLRFHLGTNL